YSRTRPYLELQQSRYTRDELLGRWPMEAEVIRREETIRVVRDTDLLWRLEGDEHRIPVGLLCATEHLTVGRLALQPGEQTDRRGHGGDLSLYVLDGTPNILLPEQQGPRWFELQPGDGFYVPEGVPYQVYNISGRPASILFGVAPAYL
ncbi:MAG TPA: cupin domain-containing protein, partial [Roseiflexaceae bacterium]|nr:cupin domain-containing protein [Roseiflexaceae bacterium]